LRHGDISIKPDISHFDGKLVHFVDGSHVEVDQVVFATGYQRQIAYLDPSLVDGSWAASHFLTAWSRRFPGLFTLGFAELNGALFPHLSRLASWIAHVAELQLKEPASADAVFRWASQTHWRLDGGRQLIDSTRHALYCDDKAWKTATLRAFRHQSWTAPKPG
jgi:hypothetical protein